MEEFWLNFMTKADLHLDYILNHRGKSCKRIKNFQTMINVQSIMSNHMRKNEPTQKTFTQRLSAFLKYFFFFSFI